METDCLPAGAVQRAQLLIGAVHDGSPAEVAALLASLDRHGLHTLTVTLAAMVPTDYTPSELLAWAEERDAPGDVDDDAETVDGPDVDAVKIERACYGEPVRLNRWERTVAIRVLTARNYADSEIAERLHMSTAAVCKARGRSGIDAAVPCGRKAS